MRGRGNGDHAVAHRDRRQDERDEADQRRLVGADDSHHAPRLVHRQRDEARLGRVHRAVVLVGEARVIEGAPHGGLDFGARLARRRAGLGDEPLGEFLGARFEVLGEIVEHLGAVVRRRRAPARRLARRLDGVAHVLAVARARRGRRLCPRDRAPRSSSRSRAAPACRRYRAWRCGRSRRRRAPARGRAGRSAAALTALAGLVGAAGATRYSASPSRPPSRPKPLSR